MENYILTLKKRKQELLEHKKELLDILKTQESEKIYDMLDKINETVRIIQDSIMISENVEYQDIDVLKKEYLSLLEEKFSREKKIEYLENLNNQLIREKEILLTKRKESGINSRQRRKRKRNFLLKNIVSLIK